MLEINNTKRIKVERDGFPAFIKLVKEELDGDSPHIYINNEGREYKFMKDVYTRDALLAQCETVWGLELERVPKEVPQTKPKPKPRIRKVTKKKATVRRKK